MHISTSQAYPMLCYRDMFVYMDASEDIDILQIAPVPVDLVITISGRRQRCISPLNELIIMT